MTWTFPLALTFLTILPWPGAGRRAGPGDLARSLFWFPWVGGLLGLIYWGVWWGLLKVLPTAPAAALLLTLTVWLTRALHLDGLADTADGLGGGRTPEESRAIMKDSRLGAFGAAALVLVLLLKFALFSAWAGPDSARIMVLFPVVSRWGMVFLAFLSPYARPEGGLGQAMTQGVKASTLLSATGSAAALALMTFGVHGLALLTAAAGVVWLLSFYFDRKLGGVTGDVLGAAGEVLEVLVLTGGLVLAPPGSPVPIPGIFWYTF